MRSPRRKFDDLQVGGGGVGGTLEGRGRQGWVGANQGCSVRFRTDNLASDTGTRRIVGRSRHRHLVATTARCGRASGENAAAKPHLAAAPFRFCDGDLTALAREGDEEARAWQGSLLPSWLEAWMTMAEGSYSLSDEGNDVLGER